MLFSVLKSNAKFTFVKVNQMSQAISVQEEISLFEMSNLRPKETGLPMVLWIKPSSGTEKHGPRVKVQTIHGEKAKLGKTVSLSISDNPEIVAGRGLSTKDLKVAATFVRNNKDLLLKFWNDEVGIGEVLQDLVRA